MTATDTGAALARKARNDRELERSGEAAAHAARLLASLGFVGDFEPDRSSGPDRDVDWAESGAMMLTGDADGPPLLAPAPIASSMRGAMSALVSLAGGLATASPSSPAAIASVTSIASIDGPALLGEHAAAFGLARRGKISAGGSCRLLRAADGWVAVNLARADDIELVPAWLGERSTSDAWAFVEERIAGSRAREVVARGRLLGLALALAGRRCAPPPPWYRIVAGTRVHARRVGAPRPPLVVDLTSLWAGPLCTHLLALAGAEVVKVESTHRPDGARRGPAAFYDLLNAGKASIALDFRDARDVAVLGRLIERADVVVESARPRALAQLGIDAGRIVRATAGKTWIAISGYGREEPGAGWIAFGDDAAAAAGLAHATGALAGREPLFCADAVADPLTGVHAAVAALASHRLGGGRLIDLSLHDVSAHLAGAGSAVEARASSSRRAHAVVERCRRCQTPALDAPDRSSREAGRIETLAGGPAKSQASASAGNDRDGQASAVEHPNGPTRDARWELVIGRERHAIRAPRLRPATGTAPSLGADTDAVLRSMGIDR